MVNQLTAAIKAALIAYTCHTELDKDHTVRFGGLGRVGAKFKGQSRLYSE
jgi:hypothetical protein